MHPVYAILDGPVLGVRGIALADAAESLLEGGIRLLQIRWKENWTAAVYEEAQRIGRLCDETGAILVINDRADVAMLLGRARPPGPPRHGVGLHLGQEDLPTAAARQLAPDLYLGRSTHNERQFREAAAEPVDYVALGPIYGTVSKPNPDPVVGTEELKRLRPLSDKPVVAIGGITLERAPETWRAGADSVAVIGDMYPPGCTPVSIRHRAGEWTKAAYEHHGNR